ncbi:Trafficking protein particle complex subunit 5 [Fasciolopsis buskii]|uniref:Trafficking protein particle complex subunit 5 n=1 Tax=Fasciolopsis buskii TaxID=27845 RepID=A0A8E0RKA8_9TREM|nr:Trafficking protein particle complex subunit 5 [Fasciolopsis buski]
MNSGYSKTAALNLEKSLSKLKGEINIATFAHLFVELVKYSMRNVSTMDAVQKRLADFGRLVGERMVDLVYSREKPQRRDIRLCNALLFLKSAFWKNLFGKEADELERDGDDENTFYMIEQEPIVNRFTRFVYDEKEGKRAAAPVPLNMATFNAGIVEAFLTSTGFPCKVTVTWYKATAYVIKFEESVTAREKMLDGK